MAYLYGVDLTEPVDLPGAIYKKYSDFSENNMIISGKAGKGGFHYLMCLSVFKIINSLTCFRSAFNSIF
jgi:hypothetical protein